MSRARLRIGRELSVLDVSNSGVLVEGLTRLLPGTHVDVHIIAREGRVLVRSQVVRAYVVELTADAVKYRGALAFDRDIDTSVVGYAIPAAIARIADDPGNGYPSVLSRDALRVEHRIPA